MYPVPLLRAKCRAAADVVMELTDLKGDERQSGTQLEMTIYHSVQIFSGDHLSCVI